MTSLCPSAQAFQSSWEAITLDMTRVDSGHFVLDVDLGRAIAFGSNDEPGQRSFPFIVDTGASHHAIAEHLAEAFGYVRPQELDQVAVSITGIFDTQVYQLPHFDFGTGAAPTDTVIIYVQPDDRFSAYGLLSANILPNRPYTLDFHASEIRLDAHAPLRADANIGTRNGTIQALGFIQGHEEPIHVLIDTGSAYSIANTTLTQVLSRLNDGIILDLQGVGSRIPQRADTRARLRNFQLGELCIPLMYPIEADLYVFEEMGWGEEPAILIGLDVLASSHITIDPRNKQVEIQGYNRMRCRS